MTVSESTYSIRQVAEATGMSAPTLRWYEEIGVLPPVRRSHSGQRLFSERDVEWLSCVAQLRVTGMSVADMVRFAELIHRGEETVAERRAILEQTRRDVRARIAELEGALTALDTKINAYDGD